jgi:hypothetical protein
MRFQESKLPAENIDQWVDLEDLKGVPGLRSIDALKLLHTQYQHNISKFKTISFSMHFMLTIGHDFFIIQIAGRCNALL